VNMGDNALNAKNAKALLFVNTGDDALDVKSAGRFYLLTWPGRRRFYVYIIMFHVMQSFCFIA
jgi:hypothetical protein